MGRPKGSKNRQTYKQRVQAAYDKGVQEGIGLGSTTVFEAMVIYVNAISGLNDETVGKAKNTLEGWIYQSTSILSPGWGFEEDRIPDFVKALLGMFTNIREVTLSVQDKIDNKVELGTETTKSVVESSGAGDTESAKEESEITS